MDVLDRLLRLKSDIISELIKENNFKNYVEVGIWKGHTLFEIAKRNKNMKIWGIDCYKSKNFRLVVWTNRSTKVQDNRRCL